MHFNLQFEIKIKPKCEKALISKLQSEINSPSNGTNYFIEDALKTKKDMSSIIDLLEVVFGVYGIFYVRWGDEIRADGELDANEAYEFSRLSLFDSISSYLEDGSRLVINGKGVELAGGKVDFI